jgi:hypothetical protein
MLPAIADLVGGEVFRFRSASGPNFLRVMVTDGEIVADGDSVDYVRTADDGACSELEYQGAGVFFVPARETGLWLFGE